MATGPKPLAQFRRTERRNKGSARVGRGFVRRAALDGRGRHATFHRKRGSAPIHRQRRREAFYRLFANCSEHLFGKPGQPICQTGFFFLIRTFLDCFQPERL